MKNLLHDPEPRSVLVPVSGDDTPLWRVLEGFPDQVLERIAVMLRRDGFGMGAFEREECPEWLTWVPSGSDYFATYCVDGNLYFNDDEEGPLSDEEIADGGITVYRPCPFCKPREFTEDWIDGTTMKPVCMVDNRPLPGGTPITYHDGPFLALSAVCSEHGLQPVDMREFDENTAAWQVWPEGAPPHE